MTTAPDNILVIALELAANGLPIFPCAVSTKCPTTPHGFKDASTDPETIKRLWRDHPGGLIGVPTGAISSFDGLDLDLKARAWWRDNRNRLPRTRTHKTRSGGLHLLFRHNDSIRCSAGKIAWGVDTRANGGYIVWWPAAGFPVLSDAPLAPWPEFLLEHFRSKPRASSDHPIARVPDNYFLAELVRMVAGAREGERNSLTFWCSCRAGEMVASGLLSASTAIAVIAEAATRSGLPRKEAERTVRSGIKTGGRNG